MGAPDEREFTTFRRGHVRDQIILAAFRNTLRTSVNPATGLTFTEDEITRATQPGSRFYIEADALDLVGQAYQQRALWLSDQIDPRRANTRMLEDFHGRLWLGAGSRLPAVGASGDVLATGLTGTAYTGSTTLGDPLATLGVDQNGVVYQVLQSEVIPPGATTVLLTVRALSGGFTTNLVPDSVLTWTVNVPGGSDPECTVQETIGFPGVGFIGGFDAENDSEYTRRIEDRIFARPASGNAPHFQTWAQQANSAVEQAFVYPVALNAGSTLVTIVQRRNQNTTDGPLARFPAAGVLVDTVAYLTPPGSPVVPERVFVLVTAPSSQPVSLVLRCAMNQGVGGGWLDVTPWPNPSPGLPESSTEVVAVSLIVSPTSFRVATVFPLPGGVPTLSGVDAPSIMVWDDTKSRFERLFVSSLTVVGAEVAVILLAAPAKTIALGDRISPYTDRAEEIALSLEAHFDALGPGEVVSRSDSRWARAARQPTPAVRYPQKVGASLAVSVAAALGSVTSDVTLPVLDTTEPGLPGNISDGPNLLTLGRVSVYAEG